MNTSFRLPVSLFPTAAADRMSDGTIADIFKMDIREVRANMSFTRDLLISRAIEGGYVTKGWFPVSHAYHVMLDELSRAISGHWSKLLTQIEREERRHVLFVIRVMRRQYIESAQYVL